MLRQLQRSLAREAVREVRAPKAAGVACIVRGTENLEVLYILRATNPLDRWSGQVAFPGGKHEEGDGSFKATAEREAFEEIGVDLADASRYEYLGRADEVPASSQLGVACFVYHQTQHDDPLAVTLNDGEVASLGWAAVSDITRVDKQTTVAYRLPNNKNVVQKRVAVDLPMRDVVVGRGCPEDPKYVLWGLTLYVTAAILHKAGFEADHLYRPLKLS